MTGGVECQMTPGIERTPWREPTGDVTWGYADRKTGGAPLASTRTFQRMQSTWEDASWQQSAHDWIDEQLASLGAARIGAIEQPHIRIWSTVMRVPTTRGVVWFKANMDALRHEAAAVSLVSARAPELVLPPLAVDTSTGWMLMPDAGEQLREVIARDRDLDRWLDVLTRYAALQIAS